MDTLTFIVELVKALAVPTAAVVISLVFRDQLRTLLARIRKGKVGSTEFEFEQEIQALTESARKALPLPSEPTTASISLSTLNPRAAILEAWLGVESTAHSIAFGNNIIVPKNPAAIGRALEKQGFISVDDLSIFDHLRLLRNQAIHDSDFSPPLEAVIQYLQLSQALKRRLENHGNER